MIDNFDSAIAVVLQHEGSEYTDNPKDAGGATKFGITRKDLSRCGLEDSKESVKNLTEEQAKSIYRKLFWDPMSLSGIDNALVATVILDQSVLAGAHTVFFIAQKSLGMKQDGVFGPVTLDAINKREPRQMCFDLLMGMAHHYADVCTKNPIDLEFFAGWENRIFSLLRLVFF